MRTAIVCWRPYQLFNAMRFVLWKRTCNTDSFDLYIVDIPAVHDYIERIKEEDCFSNVYVLTEKKGNSVINRVTRVLGFLFPKKMFLKHLCSTENVDIQYDRVIATGWHHLFVDLCEINSNAEVVLLEDGTITYIGDERKQPYNYKKYKLLYSITKKGPLSIDVSALYVNNLSLLSCEYEYSVFNMPEIDEKTFESLARVFAFYKPEFYTGKNIVFLTQPLSMQFVNHEVNNKRLIEIIQAKRHDVIVRKHPAEVEEVLDVKHDNSKCSWELLAKYIDEDWTLIGVFSSAQLVPCILYNACPRLIFVHRLVLLHNTSRYQEIDAFIADFSTKYKGEIYVPNSLEELEAYLDKV